MKKLLLVLSVFGMFMTSTTTFAQSKKAEVKQAKQAREEAKQSKNEVKRENNVLIQAKREQSNITSIETLNFSFTPTTVTPEFGVQHDITSLYPYVNVEKDNFSAQLPYMGSFYVQPVQASQVPINIYSNQFLYSVRTADGVIFKVTIVPNDVVDILNQNIKFNFTLNKNTGVATLVVTAENRNSITFTGMFNNN